MQRHYNASTRLLFADTTRATSFPFCNPQCYGMSYCINNVIGQGTRHETPWRSRKSGFTQERSMADPVPAAFHYLVHTLLESTAETINVQGVVERKDPWLTKRNKIFEGMFQKRQSWVVTVCHKQAPWTGPIPCSQATLRLYIGGTCVTKVQEAQRSEKPKRKLSREVAAMGSVCRTHPLLPA